MTETYPYLAPGDHITCDLLNGATGLTGEVVSVDLAPDGSWRCLSIRQDGTEEVLRVRGDLVALWRLGEPVQQPAPQGIAIPAGSLPPPGLFGPGPKGRQG
jgi:hypothetical protein